MCIENKGGLWTTEKAVDDDRSRLTVAEQQCYAAKQGMADAAGKQWGIKERGSKVKGKCNRKEKKDRKKTSKQASKQAGK